MSSHYPYLEKELSWLAFNERVLQEARDKTNPLIERVHFLGIYSNNLDEFYKVRFANLKRQLIIETERDITSNIEQTLKKINAKVLKMNVIFDSLYNELLLEMARNQIYLVNERQLTSSQEKWLKRYFRKYLRQHVFPIVINHDTNLMKVIKDDNTYLVVEMINETQSKNQYALLNIPSDKVSRFLLLPSSNAKKSHSLILLDNILRFCLQDIFEGCFDFTTINAYSMKITRDAEYDLAQEMESNILDIMSLGLKQRLTAEPVRILYQKDMPSGLYHLLTDKLKITSWDAVISGGRYYNFNDFVDFPSIGRTHFVNKPLPSLYATRFSQFKNPLDAITHKDILLYYPYYSFEHIIDIIQHAAFDPTVVTIKMNIYRVAKDSRILNAIINAVQNGKKVTVVVELQARFDEAANIKWAKRLTESGVKVIFSPLGLKIHAKLFLIERKIDDKIIRYAHIGTGNFNEKTAKTYTDFSLLTAKNLITNEVRRVFHYIENPYYPVSFKYLLVSPQNTRDRLYYLIDREIRFASRGLPSGIILKLNNLVDKGLVDKLYAASQAGVKIQLIVRGMCSLVPNVPGVSDNISVISIVDRFLEHARVYIFQNNTKQDVFISSADWMTRNIDFRVEVGTKILSPEIKESILSIIQLQLHDTVKARIVDKDLNNQYVKNHQFKLRSQYAIYQYLSQKEKNVGELDD